MGVIHLGPLSALPGTCIVLCALAMLYDPGGTCTVLAYRPAHYCLRPKLEYRLPLVVLTRLNRFTLSHYGSRTPLSTLHAGLTASHARLSTGCLLGFAGSGLSPDYTIHAELAHNFRTLTPQGVSIRRLYGFTSTLSLFIKKSTITVLFKSNDVPAGEISCLWNPHGPEAGSQIRFLRRSRCLFPECL